MVLNLQHLGMKVKKLAVGVTHTIALLENGDVYGWGKKEYAHPAESDATGVIPELVDLKSNNIAGLACGVTQVSFHLDFLFENLFRVIYDLTFLVFCLEYAKSVENWYQSAFHY